MTRERWLMLSAAACLLITLGSLSAWSMRQVQPASVDPCSTGALQTLLEAHGLQINRTADTNAYGMFKGLEPGSSQGIWTSEGDIGIVFFPEIIEDRLYVRDVGTYAWKIHGWTDQPAEVGSNGPLYFLVHRNMLITVRSEALLTRIREVLHR